MPALAARRRASSGFASQRSPAPGSGHVRYRRDGALDSFTISSRVEERRSTTASPSTGYMAWPGRPRLGVQHRPRCQPPRLSAPPPASRQATATSRDKSTPDPRDRRSTMPRGTRIRFSGSQLSVACVFALRPNPGQSGDVFVVGWLSEKLLHRLSQGPLDGFGIPASSLGKADQRDPSIALVGATLQMACVDCSCTSRDARVGLTLTS